MAQKRMEAVRSLRKSDHLDSSSFEWYHIVISMSIVFSLMSETHRTLTFYLFKQ